MPKPDCRQLLAELSSYLEGEASRTLSRDRTPPGGLLQLPGGRRYARQDDFLYHTLPEEDVPDEARRLWRAAPGPPSPLADPPAHFRRSSAVSASNSRMRLLLRAELVTFACVHLTWCKRNSRAAIGRP